MKKLIRNLKIRFMILYYSASLVELHADRQRGKVDDYHYHFFNHYFNLKILKLKKQLL